MTTVIQHAPANTVVVPTTQTVGPQAGEGLNATAATTSGWIQLSCAGLSVIIGIIAIIIDACYADGATSIWCGMLFYFPAGLLGVFAGKQKSQCTIIGCMVMSILSAIVCVTHFSVTLAGALNQDECNAYYHYTYYAYSYIENYDDSDDGGKIAVNSILTIVAAVEFIISIYASAVMCGGSSCCRSRPHQTVTVYQTQPNTTTTSVVHTGYAAPGYNAGYPQAMGPGGYNPQLVGAQPMQYVQQPVYPPNQQQAIPQAMYPANPPPYAPGLENKI